MEKQREIGRLLRAGTTGCVIGCRVTQLDNISFGGMVSIPAEEKLQIYGLITAIHIDDDGLVRQLVTAENISPDVMEDNRRNRSVPIEMDVLFIGYAGNGTIFHLLPPRPPLSLDPVYLCQPQEIIEFTGAGQFGYFRHIQRAEDQPVAELLSAHLRQTARLYGGQAGSEWVGRATRELITVLRDDYPTLMAVLGALRDARLEYPAR